MSNTNANLIGTNATTSPAADRPQGFLSIFDPATFEKAGLETPDALKARLRTYAAVLAESTSLRSSLDDDQWAIIIVKAKTGLLIEVGKSMTTGSKAGVARDFGLSEDTASRWQKLAKFLPWSAEKVRAEAQAAMAKGEDYQYSIDHIINEGMAAAERAGATVHQPKYHGAGKVLVINPKQRRAEIADLPSSFSASKSRRHHWAEMTTHSLGAGLRIWEEVQKNDVESDRRFFTIASQPFKARALVIARINKKNEVLALGDAEKLIGAIDFDAREPKAVEVFGIDPHSALIRRQELMDDLLIRKPPKETALVGIFEGLTMCEVASEDSHIFSFDGQQFAGNAAIVRKEADGDWLAPLNSALSVGDINEHIVFRTFMAIRNERGESPDKENSAYEVLTPNVVPSYFPTPKGWLRSNPLYLMLESMSEGRAPGQTALLTMPTERATDLGLCRVADGKVRWHVPKLRSAIAEWLAKEKLPPPTEPSQPATYIPLTEPGISELLGISVSEVVAWLASDALVEDINGQIVPSDEAKEGDFARWDGDQWVWSVELLRQVMTDSDEVAGPNDEPEPEDEATAEHPVEADQAEDQTEDQTEDSPLFVFTDDGEQSIARSAMTRDQLIEHISKLEGENQQLREQLAESERRRTAAEERVQLLETKIVHLAGLTSGTTIFDYRLTVQNDRGERTVWQSSDTMETQRNMPH